MRYIRYLAAVVLLASFLAGCSSRDIPTDTSPTQIVAPTDIPYAPIVTINVTTEADSAEPDPTTTPIPVPALDVASIKYQKFSSSKLDIGIQYPDQWVRSDGKSTVFFTQTFENGAPPIRLSLTAKKISAYPDEDKMADEVNALTAIIGQQFDVFAPGDLMKQIRFLKRKAISRIYTGTQNGQPVKGFVIMTCNTKTKLLYALHFSCPASLYDILDPTLQYIVENTIILKR